MDRVSGEDSLQARQTDSVIGALLNRRMLICVMTGLASGMPLYLLIQLVPAWLRAADVSLAEIGLFALVGLPYTWKFLWAPLMDRIALPLGRRRGWMLVAQIGLVLSIGALGYIDPLNETALVAVFRFGDCLSQCHTGCGDRRLPPRDIAG